MAEYSAGLTKKDIKYITDKDPEARSGQERAILEDMGLIAEDKPAPAHGTTRLTDEEAGYDQAAYDELMESFDGQDEDFNNWPEEVKARYEKAWNDVYSIEQKPISSWTKDELSHVTAVTGLSVQELQDYGVTQPDGLSIEELMERGRDPLTGAVGAPLTEEEKANTQRWEE